MGCAVHGTRMQLTDQGLATLTGVVWLLLLTACTGEPAAGAKKGGRDLRFPVEIATVAVRPVELTASGVGSVEAFEIVAVTAQVAGAVTKVDFVEGDQVDAARVLVEIAPERFRLAAVASAADLARASADHAAASEALARRERLDKDSPGAVTQEEIANARARVALAVAVADQARAQSALAELNQRDALVRAPLAGTVQSRAVATGQYVRVGDVLATLLRRDPLRLRFRLRAEEGSGIQPGTACRFTVPTAPAGAGAAAGEHTARITHIAGAADPASRLLELLATVDPATAAALIPGAFAQVTVPLARATAAPVIPQTAVRASERGFLAYVIEGEGEAALARERVLDLGLRTPTGEVEVRSGLKPGERVVVRGAEGLREGAGVKIDSATAAPTAGAKPSLPEKAK